VILPVGFRYSTDWSNTKEILRGITWRSWPTDRCFRLSGRKPMVHCDLPYRLAGWSRAGGDIALFEVAAVVLPAFAWVFRGCAPTFFGPCEGSGRSVGLWRGAPVELSGICDCAGGAAVDADFGAGTPAGFDVLCSE
jgi:hypothetical protein